MWKTPKGSVDLVGESNGKFSTLVKLVKEEFEKNGGEPLDTPVFERVDVLLGKYGDEAETKLIYRLEDVGGELLALRYDHTVPFVRYVKENNIKKMRRYCIGKVYRRDQPSNTQGRYREFYQADFDILGEPQDGMIAEALLLSMASNILKKLNIGFNILVNDVTNIKHILCDELGIDECKWRRICPIIDKLDKCSFESLKAEFIKVDDTLDLERLKVYLETDKPWNPQTCLMYEKLMKLADIFGFKDQLIFSNSLARGLDYYTGFIWEVKLSKHESSVIAGGRYDGLVGDLPLVGISFGISRILSLIDIPTMINDHKCYVTSIGNVSPMDLLRVASLLKDQGAFQVIYSLSEKPRKLIKVLDYCNSNNIRYLLIVAEEEWKYNKVILKDLVEKTQVEIDVSNDLNGVKLI